MPPLDVVCSTNLWVEIRLLNMYSERGVPVLFRATVEVESARALAIDLP